MVDRTDGFSVEFEDWRFNLRGGNIELPPRLNVESRDDKGLMDRTKAQMTTLIVFN